MSKLRYLALGDSYTIGTGVAEAERWPAQLVRRLRTEGLNIADPDYVARDGWTTTELSAGILEAAPKGPYDLVSLLIGVNNQYRGLPLAEYRRELHDLLRLAIEFARGEPRRTILLSIPDWSITPFAEGRNRSEISVEIDRFNAVNRDEAARAKVARIDVTPASRMAATTTGLLADDELHPSGAMYASWAELALPTALTTLRAEQSS